MIARVLTYYAAPLTGVVLSGKPDESEIEIPDADYHLEEVLEHQGRTLRVVGRKRKDGALSVTCRETLPWVHMEVAQ